MKDGYLKGCIKTGKMLNEGWLLEGVYQDRKDVK